MFLARQIHIMKSVRLVSSSIIAFSIVLALGSSANAQVSATSDQMRAIVDTSIGVGYSIQSINQQVLGRDRGTVAGTTGTSVNINGRSRAQKPFSNVSSRPTVSPYLNLFNEGLSGGADNYNTLVRPMLNQQQTNNQFRRQNEQLQRQEQALNSRFQALSARPAFSPTGNQNIFATGHRTTYFNMSHYYPR